jgi:hypothetical protein
LVEDIKKNIESIKEIEDKLELLSVSKKKIDSEISSLKSEKESIRNVIEQYLKDSGKKFISLDDGTEISVRNSAKNFFWNDDSLVIDFLKSIGKFGDVCSNEIVINKKKAKSIFDKLKDCDGLPAFVTCEQEMVLQIRRPQFGIEKELNEKSIKVVDSTKSDIESIDSSQFDGL